MKIKVNGLHIDVGDALRENVETTLPTSVTKYAENPINATVTFSKDHHEIKCDCSVHLSTGMVAQATGKGGDAYAAYDQTSERLEKQLRRYKRRLKDHHRKSPIEKINAAAFVIESDTDSAEEPADLQPVIIAESSTEIPTLSVGEAVMHMEMGDENLLMFHNEQNSTLNVVYRREDGNIGWIDPTPVSRAS
jgi:ribosomal subunit interface protein